MPLTRTSFLRLLKIGGIILIAVLIIGYAIWRSLNYARGPKIDISEPADGAAISTATVTIKGVAERANSISLNGNPLSVDEQGNFTETVIVFPGVNVLTLVGQDQFGRSTERQLRLFGEASAPKQDQPIQPPINASSTAN